MKLKLSILLGTQFALALPTQGFKDPIYQAFKAEINRAHDSLRSQGGQKPYLIRGNLYRYERSSWYASQGHLDLKTVDTLYSLDIDLRVGSPKLDQSQFFAADIGGHQAYASFPPSGDSLLVRKALWSILDQKFKIALEILPQKQNWLAEHPEVRVPPSWIPQGPMFVDMSYAQELQDTNLIANRLRSMSALLEPKGKALESRAKFEYVKTTSWYYDTEGRELRQSLNENTLVAALLDQAQDGAPIWNYIRHSNAQISKILDKDWNQEALQLQRRMDTLKRSAALKHYRGPVLFEGEATGSFWQGVLMDQLAQVPMNADISQSPHPLVQLLGQKILGSGLDLEIDPKDRPDSLGLYPRFNFDQEGAPAQSGFLIQKGRLIKLPKRLSPYPGQSDSTLGGHFQFGGFYPSFVAIRSQNAMDSLEFAHYLQNLCVEEGIPSILRVIKVWDKDALELLSHPLASQAREAAEMELLDPKTMKSTPVRGILFNPYNLKDLRSLSAFSQENYVKENHGVQNMLYPKRMILNLDDLNPRNELPPKSLLP